MAAKARISAAAIAAVVLAGASLAHADSARPSWAVTTGALTGASPIPPSLQSVHKSLQWDNKGRWTLKLDMTEPAGRTMQLRDVQAGAYYHVTPSLRVGGAVSFGDAPSQPDRTALPQDQTPRVKLETSFKF